MVLDRPPRKPYAWPTSATLFVVPGALLFLALALQPQGLPLLARVLVPATWTGAAIHLAVSWRGRREAPEARTLLDIAALVIVMLLAIPAALVLLAAVL